MESIHSRRVCFVMAFFCLGLFSLGESAASEPAGLPDTFENRSAQLCDYDHQGDFSKVFENYLKAIKHLYRLRNDFGINSLSTKGLGYTGNQLDRFVLQLDELVEALEELEAQKPSICTNYNSILVDLGWLGSGAKINSKDRSLTIKIDREMSGKHKPVSASEIQKTMEEKPAAQQCADVTPDELGMCEFSPSHNLTGLGFLIEALFVTETYCKHLRTKWGQIKLKTDGFGSDYPSALRLAVMIRDFDLAMTWIGPNVEKDEINIRHLIIRPGDEELSNLEWVRSSGTLTLIVGPNAKVEDSSFAEVIENFLLGNRIVVVQDTPEP